MAPEAKVQAASGAGPSGPRASVAGITFRRAVPPNGGRVGAERTCPP
ncbi:hypothetical protein ACFPM0_18555 [Pseudonocardia sulfidoxydans]